MITVWADSPQEALLKIFDLHLKEMRMSIILLVKGNFEYQFGIGKSYLALKLGELIDKNFSIDKVVFEPKDFKRVLKIMEEKFYQVMVIDEAGILINAKKWASFINEAIRATMMVLRNLRCMCILVSPAMKFIDADVRRMITFTAECEKHIDRTGHQQKVYARFYKINWLETQDKFYLYRLKFFERSTKKECKIGKLKISLPSEELVNAYEEKAAKYKEKIRQRIGLFEDSFLEIKTDPFSIINDILEKKDEIAVGGKISANDIKILYHVPLDVATFVAKRVNQILKEEKNAGGGI